MVAATPVAPAPSVDPDAELYAREIERINGQRQILQESFDDYRSRGSLARMEETLAEMKALPSVTCLEAEQRRGAPLYPALATCRSVSAAR